MILTPERLTAHSLQAECEGYLRASRWCITGLNTERQAASHTGQQFAVGLWERTPADVGRTHQFEVETPELLELNPQPSCCLLAARHIVNIFKQVFGVQSDKAVKQNSQKGQNGLMRKISLHSFGSCVCCLGRQRSTRSTGQ